MHSKAVSSWIRFASSDGRPQQQQRSNTDVNNVFLILLMPPIPAAAWVNALT